MDKSHSILRRLWRHLPDWVQPFVAVGSVIALIWGLIVLISSAAWDGFTTVPLEFVVVDAETNKPLPGCLVQLCDEWSPEYTAPLTGKDGRTKLVIRALCGGRDSFFGRSRSVNYGRWELRIETEGYKAFKDVLSNLTRDHLYHDENAIPPPISIQLQRPESEPNSSISSRSTRRT